VTSFDRKLITPLVLGSILNPVNSSMLAVALVPIASTFHAVPAETAWLVSGLYLATATGQPVVGRLVDRYGARTLYLAGAALVGIAGLIGTLAPSLGVLVLARVLLGFGTCAGYPAAMYLIRRSGVEKPGGVLTALSVSAQTIVVIGPTVGGLLIGAAGWRALFAVNIPLAVLCLVLGALILPRSVPSADLARLDHLGIGLFAGTLTTLMLFLMSPSARHLWLLLLTVLLGAGFAWRELRYEDPFLDVRVFGGNAPLIATYVRTLLAQTVAYAYLYGFTQWLEAGRGLSASHAGLILLPMSLVAIGVSTLTGRKAEFRGKLLVGAVSQVIACSLMLVLNSGSALWIPVLISLICGLPQGLNSLANQNAVYFQADPDRMGASAGLLRTFAYLGAMVSSAATGRFFKNGADTTGLHDLAIFLIAIAAVLLIVVLADPSLRRLGTPSASDSSAPDSSAPAPSAPSAESLPSGNPGGPPSSGTSFTERS
jgi:MFS family permease